MAAGVERFQVWQVNLRNKGPDDRDDWMSLIPETADQTGNNPSRPYTAILPGCLTRLNQFWHSTPI